MKELTRNQRSAASSAEAMDPIEMLKEDHRKVKRLFDEFERTDDMRTRKQLAKTAIDELKIHSAIEEEIFYPGVSGMVDDEDIMEEAAQEHHVVHLLVDEMEAQELAPKVFHAKFRVLSESVRHHIREEEGEMLPRIHGKDSDLGDLGTRMAERKQELKENPESLNKAVSQSVSRFQKKSGRNAGTGVRTSSRSAAKQA